MKDLFWTNSSCRISRQSRERGQLILQSQRMTGIWFILPARRPPFSSPSPRSFWPVANLIGLEYETNTLCILRKSGGAAWSGQIRALDPCHRPEGWWALGTRMARSRVRSACQYIHLLLNHREVCIGGNISRILFFFFTGLWTEPKFAKKMNVTSTPQYVTF